MKKGINCICRARTCIPCSVEMEYTHLVRRRGDAKRATCERCGKETMKGAEILRRGIKETDPPC